jgi:fatty-acyl-CoA synthase
MAHPTSLDRLSGAGPVPLRTAADLAAFEATPCDDRIAAQSTYEALQIGAAIAPGAAALQFLSKADPDELPVTVSYAQFMARVTQAAKLFHDLGVGPNDVVSLLLPLLPLLPQSFFARFGAQAAGIANPVNPSLSAAQISEILRAANARVLVVLGPVPGTDIWDKVQRVKGELPNLKAIVVVHGAADEANGVLSFDALIGNCPADRLVSGRHITADETAGYFHTGGTAGTPKLVRHSHRNQVYQSWAMGVMLPVGSGRTLLFGLPLFHVGGALTQGLAPLAWGYTLVVVSPAGWREPNAIRHVWRLVERYRPAVFGGAPTVLAAALNVPMAGADVSSIVCASGGGSAIPVAGYKAYVELLHRPVLEVYGMTETSSVHTIELCRPAAAPGLGRPCPALRPGAHREGRRRRALHGRLRGQRDRRGGDGRAGRVHGLPERGAQPGCVRRAGLGELGRPGPARR